MASTGTAKSGNLCIRCRVCSGLDTEMSSCIFSESKGQRTVWDTGETMLQGSEMQGSSGSTGFHY